MRFDAVQTIKSSLTMQEVVEHYGFSVNKAGFMCCPFHNEKTPSMKIYDGNRGFSCYGCGENGDVISFVKKLFDLSFVDTLKKIDLDFNLNIYGEKNLEELRRAHYQQKVLNARRQRQEREKKRAEAEYWAVFDEWVRLDKNKRVYAPKSIDEECNPLFIESLKKLSYQEYLLDMAEIRRWKRERGNDKTYAS